MQNKIEDLSGREFGKLTVIRFNRISKYKQSFWWCKCECGEVKAISRNRLLHKKEPTRSCGCLQKEKARQNKTHGKSSSKVYKVWSGMRRRCLNPDSAHYPDYGGRGITITSRWDSFSNFLEDMGDPHEMGIAHPTIERVDNNKGYCKSNCCWATWKEQSLNKRRTVMLTLGGMTKPLKEWCDLIGISYQTALCRLKRYGKTPEEVISIYTPNKKRK